MNIILRYLISFFNLLEHSRVWIYEKTAQWVEKREKITGFVNSIESNFTNFHPFTLIIGFFILFFVLKFLLKKIFKAWKRVSKKIIS
jgi:hypothetical protein